MKMLDEFLKNELSFNRESGTYLFYGDDLEKNYKHTYQPLIPQGLIF